MSNIVPEQLREFRKDLHIIVSNSFLGRISGDVRGLSFGFDGETVSLSVVMFSAPSNSDVEMFQDAEAEVVSAHEFMSSLSIVVASDDAPVAPVPLNFGWIFLRAEVGL